MSPSTTQKTPKSVVLRGTCSQGPLELEIPVQVLEAPGETIHQLAAKKAVHELEEGRGWLYNARDQEGRLIREKYPGRLDEIVEREAVRLGVEFQVGGKFCSFVAVEKKEKSNSAEGNQTMVETDYDFVDEDSDAKTLAEGATEEGKSKCRERRSASYNPTIQGERIGAFGVRRYVQPSRRTGSHNANLRMRDCGGSHGALRLSQLRVQSSVNSAPALDVSPANESPDNSSPLSFQPQMFQRASGVARFCSAGFSRSSAQALPPPPPPQSSSLFGAKSTKPAQQMAQFQHAPGSAFGSALMSSSRPSASISNVSIPSPSPFGGVGQSHLFGVLATCDTEEDEDTDMANNAWEHAPPRTPFEAKRDRTSNSAASYSLADPLPASKKSRSERSKDPLQALIALQTFEGFWELTAELCDILGVDLASLKAKHAILDKKVLATALAVRYMEAKLASEKASWEMIVEKASGWLEGSGHGDDAKVWDFVRAVIV